MFTKSRIALAGIVLFAVCFVASKVDFGFSDSLRTFLDNLGGLSIFGMLACLGQWLALRFEAKPSLAGGARALRYMAIAWAVVFAGSELTEQVLNVTYAASEQVWLGILFAMTAGYLAACWKNWSANVRWAASLLALPAMLLCVDKLATAAGAGNLLALFLGAMAVGAAALVTGVHESRGPQTGPRWFARVRIVLGGVLVAGGLAFAANVVLHSLDESLTPAATALMAKEASPVASDKSNGYFALVGMGAPKGQDTLAWALQVVAKLQVIDARASDSWNKIQAAGKRVLVLEDGPLVGMPKPPARPKPVVVHPWCEPEKAACIPLAMEKGAQMAELADKNSELRERYYAARTRVLFAEPLVASGWGPPISGYREGVLLSLLALSQAVAAGNWEVVVSGLEADFAFHRRVVSGASTSFFYLTAMEQLAHEILFLSELVSTDREKAVPYAPRLRALLAPVETAKALDTVLRTESGVMASTLMTDDALWLYREFGADLSESAAMHLELRPLTARMYRKNAVLNRFATEVGLARPLLKTLPPDLRKALADEMQRVAGISADPSMARKLDPFVDAMGPMLPMGEAALGWLARSQDLEALMTLVRLQVLVAEKALPRDSIPGWLQGEEARALRDPYTGAAMEFDPVSGLASFVPRGQGVWVRALKARFKGKVAVPL